MSTNTYPVFFNSAMLEDTVSILYRVPRSPSGTILQNLQVKITNTTSATRSVSVYAVPASSEPAPHNAVALNMSVPPNDYLLLPVERLANEGSIQAHADEPEALSAQPIGGKLYIP
ncbi:hypothetical protein [uncultured Microbulbifer sp.]|uniref:hypothetical protein n=1 Tax=uncultured Microbulbifer sp. TaxID=348147 RepID=UPI002601F557|nr:hypothetical protein [uncultured Microbulbifer sp.]